MSANQLQIVEINPDYLNSCTPICVTPVDFEQNAQFVSSLIIHATIQECMKRLAKQPEQLPKCVYPRWIEQVREEDELFVNNVWDC